MNGDQDLHYHNLDVAVAKIEVTLEKMEEATELQAAEYARRLEDLNGEYKRDRDRQQDFVSTERFETSLKAEKDKFSEFIQRYETRHEEIVNAQHQYVTTDKYEDKLAAEKDAREHALQRVDERFAEYVTRWEARQREIDQTIVTLSQAAAEAKRIAEDQGRQTRAEADAQARAQKEVSEIQQRKQTRNITVVGIILAAIVGLVNLVPL